MQISPITPKELQQIALILVERHGAEAFELAGEAVAEMRDLGDVKRTHAWSALQSVIDDALRGRLQKSDQLTLH
jgi:hypothetical protein